MNKVFIHIDRGERKSYLLELKKGMLAQEARQIIKSGEKDSFQQLIKESHSMSCIPLKNKKAISLAANFVVRKDYTVERLA